MAGPMAEPMGGPWGAMEGRGGRWGTFRGAVEVRGGTCEGSWEAVGGGS